MRKSTTSGSEIFLSTPSARRATLLWEHWENMFGEFLSTPSARRATSGFKREHRTLTISIHALREEGDRNVTGQPYADSYFYPRPP